MFNSHYSRRKWHLAPILWQKSVIAQSFLLRIVASCVLYTKVVRCKISRLYSCLLQELAGPGYILPLICQCMVLYGLNTISPWTCHYGDIIGSINQGDVTTNKSIAFPLVLLYIKVFESIKSDCIVSQCKFMQ